MMIDINKLREYRGLIKVKSIEELQDLAKFYIKEINCEDRELSEREIDIMSKVINKWGFAFIDFGKYIYMLDNRDVVYELYNEGIISYIDYSDIIWETN